MAKSYTLDSTGTFKLTDSDTNVLINFNHLHQFTSITADTVQYGDIKFNAPKVINLDSIAAKCLLYVRSEETEAGLGITVKVGTTTISTLDPGEWLFVPVRTTADISFEVNGAAGDRTAHYILIDSY